MDQKARQPQADQPRAAMPEQWQRSLPLVAAGFAGMTGYMLAQAWAHMLEMARHSQEPGFAVRHSLGPP